MCLADDTLVLGDWNLPKLYTTIYFLSFRVRQSTNFDLVLTVHRRYYVEIKCQLDATD
jgi:hypothetical protein